MGDFGMTNWIGQQLGSYRLVDLIGQGSFADVYLGEHLDQGSYAAIKLLQVCLDDVAAIEQFHAETHTLAKLVHPHIVRVLDAGVVEDAIPFLVMDYASGGTLRQRHPCRTILPLPRIISYVQEVAAALQYAHEQKLIHRDVKPGNMFIGQDGTILLGDFGLALDVQGSGTAMPHEVAGTVPYMAPEQLMGIPCYASDQYSLAAVVYEWLCGVQPLYDREGQLVHANPLPLRERVPGISPAVEEVVLIALAPDPLQRFASVKAFATALEQARTGSFFDPDLIAHTAEPAVTVSTDEVEIVEQITETNGEYSVGLLTSAEMSLLSKIVRAHTADHIPTTTLPVAEDRDADEAVVQSTDSEKRDDAIDQEERTRAPIGSVGSVSAERRSSPQPYVVIDKEQGKQSSPILTGIIFIVLIVIIVGGVFAALHLFM
jgi:serine/threonine protein kinase